MRTLLFPTAAAEIAVSHDGRHLAVSWVKKGDNPIRLLDAVTGNMVREYSATGVIRVLAFSPDGKRLAAGCPNQGVWLWDVESGKLIHTFGRKAKVEQQIVDAVVFDHTGTRLAVTTRDGLIRVYDAVTGAEKLTISGYRDYDESTNSLQKVCFSPDGRWLAASSRFSGVRIWEAETGREVRNYRGALGSAFRVAFSPDGRRLAAGGSDASVMIWDVTQRQDVLEAPTYALATLSPDARYGVGMNSKGPQRGVRLWDLHTGQNNLLSEAAMVQGMKFSYDGRFVTNTDRKQGYKV